MSTNSEVSDLFRKLTAAEKAAVALREKIKKAQEDCVHTWKFIEQRNCFSETVWNKIYKCSKCKMEKGEPGPPVCGICHGNTMLETLPNGKPVRYSTTMQVPAMDGDDSRIRGFICLDPTCLTRTLLWVMGD